MLGHASIVGLVEDSDEDHAAFVRLARKEVPGVEIIRWTNGEALLAELMAGGGVRRPDVLVLDLNLPGIDGAEIVRRLRTDPSTSGLPAFLLSGSERQQDIDRCYAAGANAYLTKPGSAAELRALVRMLFRTMSTFKAPSAPVGLLAGDPTPEAAAEAASAESARQDAATSASVAAAVEAMRVDQTVIDTERERYEAELRAERDRERGARERAEALQRLTLRLGNAGDAADVERLLVEALTARPGRPAARVLASTAESEAQGTLVMPDPFGEGTIAMLPLQGHLGAHHGTLRVQTSDELGPDDEAFLHAAVSAANQALARVGRVDELARRARVASVDLPTDRWWREALEAALSTSRRSGRPLSLVVVLPSGIDRIDSELGPVEGDALLLAIVDAWREEGYDLLSPSGAERWVAIVDATQPVADELAGRAAARTGIEKSFVWGVAQWDRREDGESLLFRAATAVARDPSQRGDEPSSSAS